MTLLQHHLLALSLIFITTVTLGIFILWKNPRKLTNRIFALYTFSLTWWSLWEFLTQFSSNQATAVVRLRLEYVGVCFIPTLFYHGVVILTGLRRKFELLVCYILSTLFAFLIAGWHHPLFLPDAVSVAYLPYWAKAGSLYFLFLIFFGITVFRVHQTLWKSSQREPPGHRRKQLQYLFFSSAVAYTAAIPEFSLKLGIRIPVLQPYGLYSVPLYIGLVAYAIVQFKLFDIHVVIRKSLVYSILVTVLTVGYFGIAYGVERIFRVTFGYQSVWLSVAAFALMALAFQPLKIWIQRLVDWLIFRVPQEALVKRVERLELEAIQTEKLRAISTLAAGMAHEIKNPLTSIQTFAEFIPEKHRDPEFARKLSEILSTETKRIRGIVQEVLDFAKPKPPQLKPLDIGPLVNSTVDLLSNELLKRHIKWQVDCQHDGVTPKADPNQLCQVLINLIQNAADAMPQGGSLTIATRTSDGHFELAISDTGQGISQRDLAKIFDPFFTTKENGTGLGLAMVHSIIQAHHGTIHADSTPGAGTTFTVRLPL